MPFMIGHFSLPLSCLRFTDVAGPSFYVSFIGQASLNGPLLINTTFGEQLDPTMAVPELAYWDTGK